MLLRQSRSVIIPSVSLGNHTNTANAFSTVAWTFVGGTITLFLYVHFDMGGNIFNISYPSDTPFLFMGIAIVSKLESMHLFSVWRHDVKQFNHNNSSQL